MNHEKIHEGLSDKEIRDYLSVELASCEYVSGSPQEIAVLENRIRELQDQLSKSKKMNVLLRMIEDRGWSENDISDNISKDENGYYRPFIGTESEAKALLERAIDAPT